VTELSQLRPLSAVPAGQMVKLVAIDAGQGLRSRLLAMGLVPNVRITVVSNNHPGPFVLSVKGTKMVLGRGMAHKIMVT
jgi:ferrous iron transport protein A